MLFAIAQVQASQHSDGTDTMVEPHRQVTFQSSPAKLDLLFLVLSFIPIKELFRARRMCKSWKQQIDGTTNDSLEWKEIFLAHFPYMTFCQPCQRYNGTDGHIDWKGYIDGRYMPIAIRDCRTLIQEDNVTVDSLNEMLDSLQGTAVFTAWKGHTDMRYMLRALRHLRTLFQDSGMAGIDDNVTADSLNKVLDSLQRAAVCAAVCAGMLGVPFKRFIDMGTCNAALSFIYYATRPGATLGHSHLLYEWWKTSVKVICNEIQELLVQEPESARCAAADSFDSYVKVMAGLLIQVDRFYVTRFNRATIEEVAAPEQAALRTGLRL